MVIVLLASLITFPFQMTKVVATEEAENETDTGATVAAFPVQIILLKHHLPQVPTSQQYLSRQKVLQSLLKKATLLKRLEEAFIG